MSIFEGLLHTSANMKLEANDFLFQPLPDCATAKLKAKEHQRCFWSFDAFVRTDYAGSNGQSGTVHNQFNNIMISTREAPTFIAALALAKAAMQPTILSTIQDDSGDQTFKLSRMNSSYSRITSKRVITSKIPACLIY